jgi:1-aminocyclopropane-1-carboxylate deaminase/D-cysteine desulfhydrase-like pyridoxal-dependent ACC family enzyme
LLQTITLPEAIVRDIHVDILRLDLLHPVVSGNKWFKLKYHLQTAALSASRTIITFGGAWSNHLLATAYAANQAGLRAIGIVRGQRPSVLSATLVDAMRYGMTLEFISRQQYAKKESALFHECYPQAYIVPEGGGGPPGIAGSEEILRTIDSIGYSHVLCAIGTGTMFDGLVRSAHPGQMVIGVPVLKGVEPQGSLWTGYHFGGYARHPPELLNFMNEFYRETGVPSDIVYTGKLFFALRDGIMKDRIPPSSRLLVIHSGGLQGNRSLADGVLLF